MTLTTQFYTLIAMIGMGSYFGASLDTYQRFLNRPHRKKWIVFIYDILFWMVQALQVFYVLLLVNQGELRFYSFLALVCGFAAYQALIKGIYLRLLNIFILLVKRTMKLLREISRILIYRPFLFIFKMIKVILNLFLKGIIAIGELIFRIVTIIMKIIFSPIVWIIRRIYNMLPQTFTNKLENMYNKSAGVFLRIKNTLSEWIKERKKK